MDEARRRDYLHALGVQLWVPRSVPRSRTLDAGAPRDASSHVAAEPVRQQRPASDTPPPPSVAAPAATPEPVVALGPKPSSEALNWDGLAEAVSTCRRCELHATRNRAVFGVGHPHARLMLIGEAPGAEEDRLGEPFVGRAGQLLDRMLAAIGLARDQVFIANLLKCRPPGNRNPQAHEVARCHDYLTRQLELVRPQLVLSLGRFSAQSLLDSDLSVGRLRGRWWPLPQSDIALRVTYHPAYLLRSPEQKAKSWDDLIAVRQRLDTLDAG